MEVQLWSLGTAQHGTQPAEKEEMEGNQQFDKAGDLMDGPQRVEFDIISRTIRTPISPANFWKAGIS